MDSSEDIELSELSEKRVQEQTSKTQIEQLQMAEANDVTPRGSRSEMTGDELSNIRKRSNTIVSISDDGNQVKYK